ncbi:hypothetical protein BH11ACT3_BH11ACT3_17860 [soil metagenome]
MTTAFPILAACAVAASIVLGGCTAQPAAESTEAPRAASESSPTATPTPEPTIAIAAPVTGPAPAAPAAPAYVDYVTPVTQRWGGCFGRLGVGDIYFDDITSTVTGAWNGGALTWAVGPGNTSGTPADQQSIDALAGC